MNNLIVLCPNHHSIADSLNVAVLRDEATKSKKVKVTVERG